MLTILIIKDWILLQISSFIVWLNYHFKSTLFIALPCCLFILCFFLMNGISLLLLLLFLLTLFFFVQAEYDNYISYLLDIHLTHGKILQEEIQQMSKGSISTQLSLSQAKHKMEELESTAVKLLENTEKWDAFFSHLFFS